MQCGIYDLSNCKSKIEISEIEINRFLSFLKKILFELVYFV